MENFVVKKRSKNRTYFSIDALQRISRNDPEELVADSEAMYAEGIERAVASALDHLKDSRVILLAGPSASGKTTTSMFLRDRLLAHGVGATVISMDNYFFTLDKNDKTIDYESPERIDRDLCVGHIMALERGESVWAPRYDFETGVQTPEAVEIHSGRDEVTIFEGIHALNPVFYTVTHPTGVYVSARMRLLRADRVMFRPEWVRFIRRCVRDEFSRGTDFDRTLELWSNVRRGEGRYILPYKSNADIHIDSSFACEPALYAGLAIDELRTLPKGRLRKAGMSNLCNMLAQFQPIPPSLIPRDSLLREFIGEMGL